MSAGEKRAYCEFANDLWKGDLDFLDIIPINPNSDDLFKVLEQGVLLWFELLSFSTPNEQNATPLPLKEGVMQIPSMYLRWGDWCKSLTDFIETNSKLVNKIAEKTINEKELKHDKTHNLKLFFTGAQSVGCKLDNITLQHLTDASKPHLLDAYWKSVKVRPSIHSSLFFPFPTNHSSNITSNQYRPLFNDGDDDNE